jgi:hypothetical protein
MAADFVFIQDVERVEYAINLEAVTLIRFGRLAAANGNVLQAQVYVTGQEGFIQLAGEQAEDLRDLLFPSLHPLAEE